jgi:anti-anti-sigma factor
MEVSLVNHSNCSILKLNGRFDSSGAKAFDELLIAEPLTSKVIILDFAEVSFISSVGLRSILKLAQALHNSQRSLMLAAVSPLVKQAFDYSGFAKSICIAPTVESAIETAEKLSCSEVIESESILAGKEFKLMRNETASKTAFIKDFSQFNDAESELTQVSFSEIGIAFGIGALAENKRAAAEQLGGFASLGNFVAVRPAVEGNVSDFVATKNTAAADIFTFTSLTMPDVPAFCAVPKETGEIDFSKLILSLLKITDKEKAFGYVAVCRNANVEGAVYSSVNNMFQGINSFEKTMSSNAIIIGAAAGIQAAERMPFLTKFLSKHEHNEMSYYSEAAAILTNDDVSIYPCDSLSSLAAILDEKTDFVSLVKICHGSKFELIKLFVFEIEELLPISLKCTKIETAADEPLPTEFERIIKNIYHDSSIVKLTELSGGFSAKTYYAESRDFNNRRQLPTVVKIAFNEWAQREIDAYKLYVEKYILNNSTTILGTASSGDRIGLRYNFLGITGTESKLTWLEKIYKSEPVEKLIPIFEKVFTNILKPWYGQPRLEEFRPYFEHDPNRLFSNILGDAEKELGINADDVTIDCPLLSTTLPNPFHFLKYEYPKRFSRKMQWYKSIIHGDMNMKNILLDEGGNCYVIDFSETRISNVQSDFARFEPIFKFETFRIESDEDLRKALEFEAALLDTSRIDEPPKFVYKGDDHMVAKAYKMICLLRRFADDVVIFERNIVPYLLALLEWTYPVVSYWGFPKIRKQYAVFSAALIVRKLIDLDN